VRTADRRCAAVTPRIWETHLAADHSTRHSHSGRTPRSTVGFQVLEVCARCTRRFRGYLKSGYPFWKKLDGRMFHNVTKPGQRGSCFHLAVLPSCRQPRALCPQSTGESPAAGGGRC